jgi:hypothetical protein
VARLLPDLLAETYAEASPEIRAVLPFDLYRAYMTAQSPFMTAVLQLAMQRFTPDLCRILSQKFEELIGILCLTESPANLLMWAHYADSHRGFVVEFDSGSRFFDQRVGPDDDLRHLRKVIYQEERPSIVLTEMDDFSPYLTKAKDWSYETEWRMMLPLPTASRIIGEGPTGIHLFEFPKAMIKGLILGCRMAPEKKAEIREILAGMTEYQNVYCTEARIDDRQYRIIV